MKFKVNDRVKIIEIGATDPSYLLNQVGIIIKIRKNSDYVYEIEFVDEKMKDVEQVLWQEHELDFDKPIVSRFTKVIPCLGDWEAWYLDGRLIAEGHSVRAEDILNALEDILPNKIEYIEISDSIAEMGFSKDLDNLLMV